MRSRSLQSRARRHVVDDSERRRRGEFELYVVSVHSDNRLVTTKMRRGLQVHNQGTLLFSLLENRNNLVFSECVSGQSTAISRVRPSVFSTVSFEPIDL